MCVCVAIILKDIFQANIPVPMTLMFTASRTRNLFPRISYADLVDYKCFDGIMHFIIRLYLYLKNTYKYEEI